MTKPESTKIWWLQVRSDEGGGSWRYYTHIPSVGDVVDFVFDQVRNPGESWTLMRLSHLAGAYCEMCCRGPRDKSCVGVKRDNLTVSLGPQRLIENNPVEIA